MDYGKEYIKMCDCDEIQENQPKTKGDIFYIIIHQECINADNYIEEIFEYYNCDGFTYGDSHKGGVCWHKEGNVTTEYFQDTYGGRRTKKILWLPRQDQLQEMIKNESWIKTQVSFYDFIFLTAGELCATCFNKQNFADDEDFYEKAIKLIKNEWDSFEQAWLAFVMSEKFSKKWNRKDWIKE